MSDFDAQIYQIEDTRLSEEEKEIVRSIGEENVDYCAAAIIQNRHPGKEVIYHESDSAFEVGDEKMEINFDLLREDSELIFSKDHQDFGWISEVVITLEMLFELGRSVSS